jgi:hypothetical protein
VRDVEGEIDPDEPHESVPGALLTEWVLVAAWVDPEDAEPFVVRLCSPHCPAYQRDGLLHTALYRMGE